MATKTKSRTRVRQPRRILVWGSATKGKGVAIERFGRSRGNGRYWWNVLHLKDGKVFLVHRDFSKTEAIKQAKGYGRYEETHPRHSFFKDYSRYARKQK